MQTGVVQQRVDDFIDLKVTDQAAKPAEQGLWECSKCKNKNLPSRKVCNRCKEVMPTHMLQALMASTKQAVVGLLSLTLGFLAFAERRAP